MIFLTLLDIIALILAAIHFGIPLAYYYYMKIKYLNKPWNIKINPNYKPKITIIIPTYNEAKFIQQKLDNIHEQDYPREKLEVIVIDSASTDGTPELVKQWTQKHPEINLKLIQEPERRGKAHALNHALKHVAEDTEIVIITDTDAFWPDKNTLRKVAKYLSDPQVGAVSCIKKPTGTKTTIEENYRQYYNVLRIAESKAYSTPIFHGELAAYKKKHLLEIGGFPTDIGADDSHTATKIALQGHRAITPEDLICTEAIPSQGYFSWRIRRAQHLIQHFTKTLKTKPKTPKPLKKILKTETYLHLINPWILLTTTLLLLTSLTLYKSLPALTLLLLGITLLAYKPYRTWIHQQLALIIATIRNLHTKELIWTKQTK